MMDILLRLLAQVCEGVLVDADVVLEQSGWLRELRTYIEVFL